tara:strand:+ start:344 stop:517 length:174 start_codon:yes stop_codon:yes gene_type:complete
MRTIQDVKIGERFLHSDEKGEGVVIGKTKRTITVKYEKSTCKNTYKHNDAYFYPSDF